MILNVYAAYDIKGRCYTHPFYMQNDALAIRAFGDMAQNKNHPFAKFPEDFSLFRLAKYDDNIGKFENEHQPIPLARVTDFLTIPKPIINNQANQPGKIEGTDSDNSNKKENKDAKDSTSPNRKK